MAPRTSRILLLSLNFYKLVIFIAFTFIGTNFYEIGPLYVSRWFYSSVLWHCWLGYV